MHNPTVRAWVATVAFTAAGIAGYLLGERTPYLMPHALFYAVLVLNTFFSIRLFARIAPETVAQKAIDAALVASYFALALSIGDAWLFLLAALVLFVFAPVKYVLMLGSVPHLLYLRKKLLLDLSGTFMSAAALIGALLLADPLQSAWAMTIVFTLANIYLLAIRPMYRLP